MSGTRIPLDPDELELLEAPELTPPACKRLLRFFRSYHRKNLTFFLELRERWHEKHPGRFFPGLCANVNPISGEFRPDSEQRLWGWGDARALGTWSGFLNTENIPDAVVTLCVDEKTAREVNLRDGIRSYVDIIYNGLLDRYLHNGRTIPFSSYYETGRPDDNPQNRAQEIDGPNYSNIFAINGFFQHGILSGRDEAIEISMELLDRLFRYLIHGRSDTSHGPWMILLGIAGEALKTVAFLESRGIGRYSQYAERFLAPAVRAVDHILDNYFREDPPAFWEKNGPDGNPAPDEEGHIVVDPGHATECAGFLAELVPFLPRAGSAVRWDRDRVLQAALTMHLFADGIGFSRRGVMVKYVDLETGKILPDKQAGVPDPTAPWFGVREHSAAALRLYTLTRDSRLPRTYRRAQNASYLHYPNKRIGGLMVQTVDPFTLEAVDIQPATGNLDPMHDARARVREIECLEILLS